MNVKTELLSHSQYVKELRALLPSEAFAPAPNKLSLMFAHAGIILCSYLTFAHSRQGLVWFALSLIIGHSLGCLAFLTHELSHGAILRSHRPRYWLEVFFWSLNIIPATVWRRVHNQTHHVSANTQGDPDRRFRQSEESFSIRWYTRLFQPHRGTIRWNPLVAFQFIPYILGNTLAAFLPASVQLRLLHAKPLYTAKQRCHVALELAVIITVQVGIYHLVGNRLSAYFWAGPMPLLWMSTVVMTYVFTNHFLNPLGDISDPLSASTSVVVWPEFDRLHSNFSYHTEHHLFPSMNSDFYPLVSDLLQKRHATRYHRVSLGYAWHRLWAGEAYAGEAGEPETSSVQRARGELSTR